MSRIFTADFSQLPEIMSVLREGLFSLGCDEDSVNTAHVICDEFITNIIKNAYGGDNSGPISIDGAVYEKPLRISYEKAPDHVCIEIADRGRPFNPLEYESDFSEEGGCGIHIARSLADSIAYRRTAGENIVTFCIR